MMEKIWIMCRADDNIGYSDNLSADEAYGRRSKKVKITPMRELTIVRQNMMDDVNYMGYCGNAWNKGCSMPRTVRHGDQFRCPECGWISQYPDDFIKRYKAKHNLT